MLSLFISTPYIFSQNIQKIQGHVIDSNAESLTGALVTVLDTTGQVDSYSIVERDGRFEIAVNYDTCDTLVVNMIGYSEYKEVLRKPTTKKTIVLLANTRIEEVIVVGSKKFNRINEDTVRYKPEYYADSTDVTVEQMLAKLPGIEVGIDGDIKYRGQDISTILIEGDNLFESSYKVASKNLRSIYVDEVEVIDKYDDNFVVQRSKTSKEIALNLKLKSKYKNMLSGNVLMGAGSDLKWKSKYLLNTHLFNLQKSLKVFGIQDSGNTGTTLTSGAYRKPAFDKAYDFDKVANIENPYMSINTPNYTPSPELMDNGNGNFSSLRGIYKIGSQSELRASSTYSLKSDYQLTTSIYENFVAKPTYKWEQNSLKKYRLNDFDASLKFISRMPDSDSEIRILLGHRNSQKSNQDSTALNSRLRIPFNISTVNQAHDLKFQYSKLLKSNNILLASLSYNSTDNIGEYVSENGYQYRHYKLDPTYQHFLQSNDINRKRILLSIVHIASKKNAKYISKIFGNWNETAFEDLKQIQSSSAVKTINTKNQILSNKVGGSLQVIYLALKKTRLDLKTTLYHQGLQNAKKDMGYNLRLGLERNLTSEYTWNVHLSKWASLPPITDLNTITIWNSANSAHSFGVKDKNTSGVDIMTSINRLDILGRYSWRLAFHHKQIFSGVLLSNDFGSNNYFISNNFIGPGDNTSNLYASVHFTIPGIKGNFTTSNNISWTKSNTSTNRVLNPSYVRTYKTSTYYKSRLSEYWYIDTGLKYRRSLTTYTSDHLSYSRHTLDANVKISCHINRWIFSCYGMYTMFSSENRLTPSHFLKFSVSKTINIRNRDSTLMLSIINLTNQKTRSSIIKQEDFIHRQTTEVVPMYAVLSWSLSI